MEIFALSVIFKSINKKRKTSLSMAYGNSGTKKRKRATCKQQLTRWDVAGEDLNVTIM